MWSDPELHRTIVRERQREIAREVAAARLPAPAHEPRMDDVTRADVTRAWCEALRATGWYLRRRRIG